MRTYIRTSRVPRLAALCSMALLLGLLLSAVPVFSAATARSQPDPRATIVACETPPPNSQP